MKAVIVLARHGAPPLDPPAAIERARDRHPREKSVHAWPFRASDVAVFPASQPDNFADSRGRAVRV